MPRPSSIIPRPKPITAESPKEFSPKSLNVRRHVWCLKLVFQSCGAKSLLHFRELHGSNNKTKLIRAKCPNQVCKVWWADGQIAKKRSSPEEAAACNDFQNVEAQPRNSETQAQNREAQPQNVEAEVDSGKMPESSLQGVVSGWSNYKKLALSF